MPQVLLEFVAEASFSRAGPAVSCQEREEGMRCGPAAGLASIRLTGSAIPLLFDPVFTLVFRDGDVLGDVCAPECAITSDAFELPVPLMKVKVASHFVTGLPSGRVDGRTSVPRLVIQLLGPLTTLSKPCPDPFPRIASKKETPVT